MARFQIHRRTVLRGAAGTALALPALEIMASKREGRGEGLPTRYVVAYAGVSIGAYETPFDYVTPTTQGADYELTRGLAPIGGGTVGGQSYPSMKGQVGLVSGLKIPWNTNGTTPPAGTGPGFHGLTMVPHLAGLSSTSQDDPNSDRPDGPTSDQLVADAFAAGSGATLHKSLALRVQATAYYKTSDGGNAGILSWTKTGQPVTPTVSPRLAYQSIFGGASSGSGGANQSLAVFLERRKSILDFVKDNTQRLIARVGVEDRQRLQLHFNEIRDLETRIDALAKNGGTCEAPTTPGADPPISPPGPEDDVGVSKDVAYSNEELRADIMTRCIASAFKCSYARVASLLITIRQCYMVAYPLFGQLCSIHGFSHFGNGIGEAGPMADAVAWNVKHFARLAALLHEAREVDGSRLLDNTAMVMGFEGGHGRDAAEAPNFPTYAMGRHSPHSTENMIVLVAGGAGGMKSGQHIHFTGEAPPHPAQVLLTAMNAVGVKGPLGLISKPIPELFVSPRSM